MSYGRKNEILCALIQKGNKDAETMILKVNDGLIHSCVNKAKDRHLLSHLYEYEDAVIDASMAVIEAAKRYDPKQGSFSTYATWYIRHAIGSNASERYAVHIPVNVETDWRLGRLKADTEAYIEKIARPHWLEEIVGEEDDGEVLLEETIPIEEDRWADARESLEKAMETLTERERYVLTERYGFYDGEYKTLEKVGDTMGITRDRVRQIEQKALRKLLHPSRSRDLRIYLYE